MNVIIWFGLSLVCNTGMAMFSSMIKFDVQYYGSIDVIQIMILINGYNLHCITFISYNKNN